MWLLVWPVYWEKQQVFIFTLEPDDKENLLNAETSHQRAGYYIIIIINYDI